LLNGWSQDGLQTFNQLAKEVYKNRKEYGEEFNKAYKKALEEEMASTNKTGKRKRSNIDTYDDLNDGAFLMKDAKSCDEDEEEDEQWVAKNVFIV